MSKLSHSFSVSVACILGINKAIILQHLLFLQDSSPDGWVRKSNAAMRETYPYLTAKQVRTALDQMERDEILMSKIENANLGDRTKSYFVTEVGAQIYGLKPFAERANAMCQKGKSEVAERANVHLPKGQMLYRYNIDNSYKSSNNKEAEVSTLKTETPKQPLPPNSAPPPSPRGYGFEAWIDNLTEDYRVKESFTLTYKIPAAQFEDYLQRFTALARTQPETYNRQSDVSRHFLNWSSKEHAKQAPPPSAAGAAVYSRPKKLITA